MAPVEVRRVTKRFGGVAVVDALSLEVFDGEFMVLVGPSGCGKTTTLRMIAGLENASEGDLLIDSRRVNDVAPRDRNIAMVFQNYALYPHMDVRRNLGFSLNMRRTKSEVVGSRVDQTAGILELSTLLDRKPRQLSGGQRQRVALGRAIVREPSVFLMDEPLSNLDAKLRAQTRAEISRLHERLGATTIYVTHDQVEAMTMGQRIAVMNDGRLLQVGTPRELFEKPANRFVAGFLGSPAMNFATVALRPGEETGMVGDRTIPIPDIVRSLHGAARSEVILGVRPDHIALSAQTKPGPGEWRFEATADVVEYLGATQVVHFPIGDSDVLAIVPSRHKISRGSRLPLSVNAEHLIFFDSLNGEALRDRT